MGFDSVYRTLQIIFPQVDARLLRAVAIENSKDADTAVEVVLMEVIPYLSKGDIASGSSNDSVEDASTNSAKGTPHVDSAYMDETIKILNGSPYSKEGIDGGHEQSASLEKHGKSTVKDGPVVISLVEPIPTLYINGADDYCDHGAGNTDATTTGNPADDLENFDGAGPCSRNTVIPVESSHQEQSPLDGSHLEVETAGVQLAPSPIKEYISDAPKGVPGLALVDPLNGDSEKPESSGSSDDTLKNDASSSQMVDFEDESALNTVVTRSGQICRINQLDEIIEDAKNDKKTLFLAMESLIRLMREMELQEKAAEQAKEEAASGGFDILFRVEDLRQMLQHAKEANSMHAGEVYGEKAILATEVRELQSRLLCLSNEKDKSLAILDEMRQAIEERLNAAEKERKTAEKEKTDKEESARNALAEEQLIMEKVVQESKMLKQEAEENSKLQEFLMDRGRVVDMLQGEISVICQDVKLLKEKFEERVPLSKSLSSSQTTCILASSSSSLKSALSPHLVPKQAESMDNPEKVFSGVEEQEVDDRKVLSDDGWEIFDNREFDM